MLAHSPVALLVCQRSKSKSFFLELSKVTVCSSGRAYILLPIQRGTNTSPHVSRPPTFFLWPRAWCLSLVASSSSASECNEAIRRRRVCCVDPPSLWCLHRRIPRPLRAAGKRTRMQYVSSLPPGANLGAVARVTNRSSVRRGAPPVFIGVEGRPTRGENVEPEGRFHGAPRPGTRVHPRVQWIESCGSGEMCPSPRIRGVKITMVQINGGRGTVQARMAMDMPRLPSFPGNTTSEGNNARAPKHAQLNPRRNHGAWGGVKRM